eukprot:364480-Chlamydomonas_euryale.AAC.22
MRRLAARSARTPRRARSWSPCSAEGRCLERPSRAASRPRLGPSPTMNSRVRAAHNTMSGTTRRGRNIEARARGAAPKGRRGPGTG